MKVSEKSGSLCTPLSIIRQLSLWTLADGQRAGTQHMVALSGLLTSARMQTSTCGPALPTHCALKRAEATGRHILRTPNQPPELSLPHNQVSVCFHYGPCDQTAASPTVNGASRLHVRVILKQRHRPGSLGVRQEPPRGKDRAELTAGAQNKQESRKKTPAKNKGRSRFHNTLNGEIQRK